ncbi:hypothetical protein B0H13DRAFT_2347396 [Mycena leptocephala]|nr:hypothetical protein B0H13DRAFT_2347396 [Mycena leptocephala]
MCSVLTFFSLLASLLHLPGVFQTTKTFVNFHCPHLQPPHISDASIYFLLTIASTRRVPDNEGLRCSHLEPPRISDMSIYFPASSTVH